MIDEKEVLKILKRYEGRMNPTAYFSLEADIVNIEPVEAPLVSTWAHQHDDYFDWWECENCGFGSEGELQWQEGIELRTNYCPCCGAKMVEPQESEDT